MANNGFSDHEILIKIWEDLKQHIKDGTKAETDLRNDLAKRPTRAEILMWISSTSAILGAAILFGG